jgi:fibronectin type 3 domain-containing protein
VYVLRAVDGAGNASAPSNAVGVVVDRTAAPAPAVTADERVTAAAPVVRWPAAADATAVRYTVARDGATVWTGVDTAFRDTGAADGDHDYSVTAVDAAGNASPAGHARVVVDTAAPAAPGGVAGPTRTVAAPAISWSAAGDRGSGVSAYRVLRDGAAVATVTGTSYTDAGAPTDARLSYAVVAVDGAGNASAASTPLVVAHVAQVYAGVSVRLGTDSSAGQRPDLRMVSITLQWSRVEPSPGAYDWSRLDASLRDARANHYRVIVRLMAGAYAPAWLATDPAAPVARLSLIATDGDPRPISVPVPWDPDLLVHYRALMAALEAHLEAPDGQGGRLADVVEFVPVAMPTELGAEMPMGYGSGTFTGAYKGVVGTYDVAATNRAEWLAAASRGVTAADRLAAERADLEAAWEHAVDAQMSVLTSVPSAIALGGLWSDNYDAARDLASRIGARYPRRLWVMTTNLQPKVRADGSIGPWSEWNPAAAAAVAAIRDPATGVCGYDCATVGFQSAGSKAISSAQLMQATIDDAIANWNMRFFETSPELVGLYPDILVGDAASAQARIVARAAQ